MRRQRDEGTAREQTLQQQRDAAAAREMQIQRDRDQMQREVLYDTAGAPMSEYDAYTVIAACPTDE